MKPKNKKSNNIYLYMGILFAVGVAGFIGWSMLETPETVLFTLVDNSSGSNSVTTTTTGTRTNAILAVDRDVGEICFATAFFTTEATTNGVLTLEMYIEVMDRRCVVDIGLIGDTGYLYEWENFTDYVEREAWISVKIEYDLQYNRATLYVNNIARFGQQNFYSNPSEVEGFYIRTNTIGSTRFYIDVLGTN